MFACRYETLFSGGSVSGHVESRRLIGSSSRMS